MSLSLTCKNQSYVHTLADTRALLRGRWLTEVNSCLEERELGEGGREGGRRGEARDSLVVYREWRSN